MYEREHQSMVRLGVDTDDQDKFFMSALWCVVCWTYLRLRSDTYRNVWYMYQWYSSPGAVKWPNILLVCELLFSSPY